MDMLFFTAAGTPLFSRADLEEGHWVQEEMSVTATFPYDAGKVIMRGMRLGFTDPATGNFQAFEVRHVQNIEPDHYQQIRAEHIIISDLSDEHVNAMEITDKTPAQALAAVLAGQTRWAVGNVTAVNVSSCDIARGSIWNALQTIQTNWNVYLVPRIVYGAAGITALYIDCVPAAGTFRGLRLSISKNISDSSVTYDDTELYTALYGYGGSVDVPQQGADDTREQLMFTNTVWQEEAGHPAKPAGQAYLEWPEKTALYGRAGRPRFGYYQNSDITDAETLLQKTWEQLQSCSNPKISISGTCTDLHRLGYADVPIALHDVAIVEIEETGEKFSLEIIRLDVDLVDPSATVPEIGAYIPNIIYIQRRTEEQSSGGGGGGGSGGQTNREYEEKETWTNWEYTDDRIGMLIGTRNGENYVIAGEIALAINKSGQTGSYESTALINADHVNISATTDVYTLAGDLYHDATGKLVIRNAGGLYVQRTEDGVTAQFGVWDNGNLNGGVMVSEINGQSTLKLSADVIDIDGIVTALAAKSIGVGSLEVEGETTFKSYIYAEAAITCEETIRANTGFDPGDGYSYTNKSFVHQTFTLSNSHIFLYTSSTTSQTPTGSATGQLVTGVTNETIYYLGRTAS